MIFPIRVEVGVIDKSHDLKKETHVVMAPLGLKVRKHHDIDSPAVGIVKRYESVTTVQSQGLHFNIISPLKGWITNTIIGEESSLIDIKIAPTDAIPELVNDISSVINSEELVTYEDGMFWSNIQEEQLAFLVQLFGQDWNVVAKYHDHSPEECKNFWKRSYYRLIDEDRLAQEIVIESLDYEKFGVERNNLEDLKGEDGKYYSDAHLTTLWPSVNHKVLVSKVEAKILDEIHEDLIKTTFPYSKSVRKYAWMAIIIWILGCNFLIVIYGIQFDLEDIVEVVGDILGLYDDASLICPSNPYMALDYVDRIQYDSQSNDVNNALAPFGGIFGEGVKGSTKWLLTLLSAVLMAWFINMPGALLAGAWMDIYFGVSYKKRDVQEWVEEARRNGKLDVTDDDLVFNTAQLIEAKRLLETKGDGKEHHIAEFNYETRTAEPRQEQGWVWSYVCCVWCCGSAEVEEGAGTLSEMLFISCLSCCGCNEV